MPLPGNPVYRPGSTISASELQRTSDLADRSERGGVAGVAASQNDGGGLHVAVPPPAEWWIKITGNVSSPMYFYNWVTVRKTIDRLSWEDDDQGPLGFYDSLPAIEINDDESVPDGTITRAWLGDDGESVYFDFTGGTGGGGGGDNVTHNYVNNSTINIDNTSTLNNAGKTILTGPLYQPYGTLISLTSDVDDLVLPSGNIRVLIAADEDYWRINSINPGLVPAGRIICIHNGGDKVILLGNLTGGGTAAWRIKTTTANDYFLGPDGEATLVYDLSGPYWRVGENYEERLGGYYTNADWTADVHDWNPLKRYHHHRVNPTVADVHLTGIAGGAPGLRYRVTNINSVNGYWIDHNSLSSADENRFLLPNGEDIWVAPRARYEVEWDLDSEKWRVMSLPQKVTLAAGRIGYGSAGGELTGTLDLVRESEAVVRIRGSTGSAIPILRTQRNIEGVDLSDGDIVGQRVYEPLYDASYVECFEETIKHWETEATDKTAWEVKVGSGAANRSALKAGTNGKLIVSQAATVNKLVGTGATHGELINVSVTSPYLVLSGGNLTALCDLLTPLHDTQISVTSDTIAVVGRMHALDGSGCTLFLPNAATSSGKLIGIRVEPSATGLFVIDAYSTDLIDGAATRIMWAGESAILLCDGTSWHKIAGKTIPMIGRASNNKALASYDPINHATVTVVPFDAADIDNTGLMVDLANDRITCRRSGNYQNSGFVQFCGTASFGGLTAGGTRFFSSFPGAQPEIPAVSGSVPAVGSSTTYPLTAGSNYQLTAFQDTGVTQYIAAGVSNLSLVEIPSW